MHTVYKDVVVLFLVMAAVVVVVTVTNNSLFQSFKTSLSKLLSSVQSTGIGIAVVLACHSSPAIGYYPFILLSGERPCDSKVSSRLPIKSIIQKLSKVFTREKLIFYYWPTLPSLNMHVKIDDKNKESQVQGLHVFSR